MATGDIWVVEGIVDALGTHTITHIGITYSSFILRDRHGQRKIYNEVWVGPNAGTQIKVGRYARFFFADYKKILVLFAVLSEGGLYEDMNFTAKLTNSGRSPNIVLLIFGLLCLLLPTLAFGGPGFIGGCVLGGFPILWAAYHLNLISTMPTADRMKALVEANS